MREPEHGGTVRQKTQRKEAHRLLATRRLRNGLRHFVSARDHGPLAHRVLLLLGLRSRVLGG